MLYDNMKLFYKNFQNNTKKNKNIKLILKFPEIYLIIIPMGDFEFFDIQKTYINKISKNRKGMFKARKFCTQGYCSQ